MFAVAAFLMVMLLDSTSAVGDGVPLGFHVLGTRIPAQAESVPIPSGWTEESPDTNRPLPELTEAEKRRGYVVFVKNYLEAVYPVSRPVRAEIGDRIDLFSARGEYEPASFAVHALTDLQSVEVVAGDLAGPAGSKIGADHIEIRAVRCMPRRVWGKPAYIVAPTLLEKRRRTDIRRDTTQQFWLTVWIPPDSPSGRYRGTVRIRAKGREESSLCLQIDALAITLMKPPTRHGMYYAPVDVDSGPRFKLLPIERVRSDLLNMKEHGMNTLFVSIPPFCNARKDAGGVRFDLEPLRPFVETCLETGFSDVIYNLCISELIANPLGDFRTMLAAYAAGFRERGWPLTLCSVGDEADANNSLSLVMSRLPVIRKTLPGVRIYESIVWPKHSEAFEPYVDIRAFSSYMDKTAAERTRRRPDRCVWQYSGTAAYGLDPKGDRLYRGIWASTLALAGTLQWSYFAPALDRNQPFNDLIPTAARNNMTCWVFPGEGGPLPSVGWEAMREGIEDEKYIYTLKTLLRQAYKSQNEDVKATARKAEEYLGRLHAQVDTSPSKDKKVFPIRRAAAELQPGFFDEFRWTIAQSIMKLSQRRPPG